jgi:hypothetical protein
MNPNIWGPHLWNFLHTISFNYPDVATTDVRESHYNFFNSLIDILPCDVCRVNYKKKLQNLNLLGSLNTKEDFVDFVINLHNNVSKDLGKSEYMKEDVIKKYSELYNSKYGGGGNNENVLYIVYIILFVILMYYVIKKYKQ